MGDPDSRAKPEEHYPLLKVEGGGDITNVQSQQYQIRIPVLGVTCCKKYPRFSRWPELISACWMTLILCGISFLIFYALGMGVYRRQQFIILKCNNNSKPGSNVFYHYIVPRGHSIPFVLYTEYLAYMASQYPSLRFHVFFLTEDFYPDTIRGLRRNLPYYAHITPKLDEIGKEVLAEFQKRYENVNVTIMPLSKYMASTSLRFKYRMIPTMYLPFYIRVFSVWQNGGIGMDLKKYNNDYHLRLTDPRIFTILKQHNDGINAEDYSNAMNKLEKDQENALFTILYGLINHLLNDTNAMFNKSLILPAISTSTEKNILIRTHRNKRAISDVSITVDNGANNDSTQKPADKIMPTIVTVTENYTQDNKNLEIKNSSTSQLSLELMNETVTQDPKSETNNGNGSEARQIVFFYDFSIFSDVGPTYLLPLKSESINEPFLGSDVRIPGLMNPKLSQPKTHKILSLESGGNFIAASTKLHPFLGHLISLGCQRLPPKFAIQDTLTSQCSGLFRDDVYCNNIFIL